VIVAGIAAAAAGSVAAVAINVATGGAAPWFPAMDRHPLWWAAGSTALVAAAGLFTWQAQRRYDQSLADRIPVVRQPEPWWVSRPDEIGRIVTALQRKEEGGTVGITTALQGAGGFGKTTIARMTCADPRVLQRYGGRVYWVTVGRDAGKVALAGLVGGLITRLEPGRPVTFTDARQAAEHLAAILASGPRRLLVLDDVWTQEQLDTFPVAGKCARLVTTRVPSLTAGTAVPVTIDEMTIAQAQTLLQHGLPPLPPAVITDLLAETGRWPLLLRLVNKILASQAVLDNGNVPAAAGELLDRLRAGGALQADELTGTAARPLDLGDPDQRATAVRATIEASTSLLTADEASRLADLAVFAEDETIPLSLITALWRHSAGGTGQLGATALAARLADLALLSLAPGGAVTMHDVIRDYLRARLGPGRLTQLHNALLNGAAAALPAAPAASGSGTVIAWWQLPEASRYLYDHLIGHLIAAGRDGEADTVACDLRWAAARLDQAGLTGPYADLALAGTSQALRMQRLVSQNAHLLAPTRPAYSRTDILLSRVAHDPDWGPQARAVTATRAFPGLRNAAPLPDLPDPLLRRTLTGHQDRVNAVAIAPDGTWLATASDDRTVRTWDAATGQPRAVLTHDDQVNTVAIAPDGTWLATVSAGTWVAATSAGRNVRTWDAATAQPRAVLAGHQDRVNAVAIAPDGTWLATASDDRTVRTWDAATGQPRAVLTHDGGVNAVAIAPDGTWLATASNDRTVRTWDAATGQPRAVLTHDLSWQHITVAIAPDGTSLATTNDGKAQTWDAATGQPRAVLTQGDGVTTVAIAPDGTWLATVAGYGQTVRTWDAATGQPRAVLAHSRVRAVAIAPDGTWLATASADERTVRTWDPATGQPRAVLTHDDEVETVAIAPDGTWLATTSSNGKIRIWDAAASQPGSPAAGFPVKSVAFAPDGTWLATTGTDEKVRIWDAATGQPRAALARDGTGNQVADAVAIAPDGTWLAIIGTDGIRTWDAATGQPRAVQHPTYEYWATAVAIAPDGTWLATTGTDEKVRIWDAATGQPRAVLTHHFHVNATAFAPDGTWLATASNDGAIRIWDVATGQQRAVLTHDDYVNTVAIAPDSTWLATASTRGELRIWDVATGQPGAVLTHDSEVNAVAIAPDGTWLATTSNGRARIWDAATGQQRAVLTHDSEVNAVAIAPDGTWLATTSNDRAIRIWDAATGELRAVMRADSPLTGCAWSPSSRMIAAASDAGLYLYTFSPGGPQPAALHGNSPTGP
jgi:WD40 repeat protein